MLKIHDLHVAIDGNEILKGINLEIAPNEIHALMGPNGHGKSTLLAAIMGHPRAIFRAPFFMQSWRITSRMAAEADQSQEGEIVH